jgi:hypothetical protein
MTRSTLIIVISLFLVSSLGWQVFNGEWESKYITQDNHQFIIPLEASPVWKQPQAPSYQTFQQTFSDNQIPTEGKITVIHKWDWWFTHLFIIWLIGSLVLTPLVFTQLRKDRSIGIFLRLGAGLIISSLLCLGIWMIFGGWGPPAPLFFSFLGLFGGAIWAYSHHTKLT